MRLASQLLLCSQLNLEASILHGREGVANATRGVVAASTTNTKAQQQNQFPGYLRLSVF
jgi:hypothetical protein